MKRRQWNLKLACKKESAHIPKSLSQTLVIPVPERWGQEDILSYITSLGSVWAFCDSVQKRKGVILLIYRCIHFENYYIP